MCIHQLLDKVRCGFGTNQSSGFTVATGDDPSSRRINARHATGHLTNDHQPSTPTTRGLRTYGRRRR